VSLVVSGNAGNVTTPLAATIIGMADNGSGVIRVQTSAPHLFATGDYVHIVTITTVINTYFSITVIDATHFDLDGSTYTGTGTGTATDASLTPQIQVPTDGDTFSLQLSGMLSALQALCDRTQFLRKAQVQKSTAVVLVIASGNVVIPPWATHMLLLGCGGGGGGGGGMGGFENGGTNHQFSSGAGGAGAQLNSAFALPLGATSLDVVIGTGGLGGAGSIGAALPLDAARGIHGLPTTIARHDGFLAGIVFASFFGGAGGGGGSNEVDATSTTVPVYTPGGEAGPGGSFRNAASKRSHRAPSPAQMYNIDNNAGTLSVVSGAWDTRVYTDPIGQRGYSEGGASMATAGNATYAAGTSYDGAPSTTGEAGGLAGTQGTAASGNQPGAAGGGGGGGAFGPGGNGGNGGNGSTGIATVGTPGANAAANTGGGGGGGGGGGNTSALLTNNDGAAGGNGGSGAVWIIFLAAPGTP
jgi:hypothetical protein